MARNSRNNDSGARRPLGSRSQQSARSSDLRNSAPYAQGSYSSSSRSSRSNLSSSGSRQSSSYGRNSASYSSRSSNYNSRSTRQSASSSRLDGTQRDAYSTSRTSRSSSRSTSNSANLRSGASYRTTQRTSSRLDSSGLRNQERNSYQRSSTRLNSRDLNSARGADRARNNSQNQRNARAQSPAYGTMGQSTQKSGRKSILSIIGGGIVKAFKAIGWFLASIWHKSKVLSFAIILIIIAGIGIYVDTTTMADKIFQGVKIGKVDVSNMTVSQAQSAINEAYSDKMFDTQVFVFANEQTAEELDIDMALLEEEALAEQISYEEAQQARKVWIADAVTLGAEFPAESLAEIAFMVGRGDDWAGRITAFLNGRSIEPKAEYNDVMLESLLKEVESSAGDPMMDYGVSVVDGVASITEGHDGYNVNRDSFISSMDNFFFEDGSLEQRYVAEVKFTPMRIGQDKAQTLADAINDIIVGGASFTYADAEFNADATALGSWIDTEIQLVDGEWKIIPTVNDPVATSALVKMVNAGAYSSDVNVSITQEDDNYIVQPDKEITIPSVTGALEQLDEALFSQYKSSGSATTTGAQYQIPVVPEQYDGSFTLEDALSYGIVSYFSSYTTTYNNKPSTVNRTYNIHLAADKIDDSLVKADGGEWSFNDTAGDCNEENGFRAAGTIMEGELTDAIGGGICQVATTVYNAVYDSGLPILERHNHSLYMSSYPDGRDAAVAYPTLDLIWQNDTHSDILLTTDYTDTTVTVNLIGVNPNLTVETEVGEWEKGDKYSIKVETEDTLAEGKSYVKTKGQDGRVIDVKRTVKDSQGNIVREKTFVSIYSPINMVIAAAPGENKADLIAEAEEAREKAEAKANKSSS